MAFPFCRRIGLSDWLDGEHSSIWVNDFYEAPRAGNPRAGAFHRSVGRDDWLEKRSTRACLAARSSRRASPMDGLALVTRTLRAPTAPWSYPDARHSDVHLSQSLARAAQVDRESPKAARAWTAMTSPSWTKCPASEILRGGGHPSIVMRKRVITSGPNTVSVNSPRQQRYWYAFWPPRLLSPSHCPRPAVTLTWQAKARG